MSKINVIGAACADVLISGVDKDQLFSGKYKVDSIRTSTGGDALNETLVLNHFGYDAKLISVLGDDLYGRYITDQLDARNVKYNSDIIRDDIETYVSLVFIDEKGQRIFTGNKNGSVRRLRYEDISIDDDCRIVSFASLFISPELDDDSLVKLFSNIKKRDIILCTDCSTPKKSEKADQLRCLEYVDYFFCNETEAMALSGEKEIAKISEALHRSKAHNIIIKCGENGCFCNDSYYNIDLKTNVTDTTGAGDSFVAGFISALSDGLDMKECLDRANLFGHHACSYTGATTWLDEVEKSGHLI